MRLRVLWEHDKKLAMYGNQAEIDSCTKILNEKLLPQVTPNTKEGEIRPLISSLIDSENIKASILYDGNSVWSKKRILKDIRRVKKNGMGALTDYLYDFFNLCCGSIAHYNKFGWIDVYPTISALKAFFVRNEYGESVYNHVPAWKTDVKDIVLAIHSELGITKRVAAARW